MTRRFRRNVKGCLRPRHREPNVGGSHPRLDAEQVRADSPPGAGDATAHLPGTHVAVETRAAAAVALVGTTFVAAKTAIRRATTRDVVFAGYDMAAVKHEPTVVALTTIDAELLACMTGAHYQRPAWSIGWACAS